MLELKDVILLTLGWLSGVLSPIVVDAIRQRRESGAVVAAVKGELNETAYLLSIAAYNVAMHLGTVDRAFLKWVQDAVTCYGGSEPKDKILESIQIKLTLSDDQLSALAASEAAHFSQAIALPKFAVPFVDARIPTWHTMPATIRMDLHAVRSDMRHLEDIVDQSRIYFNLTFSHGEKFDYASVVNNLRGLYEQYLKRCRICANRIQRLQGAL